MDDKLVYHGRTFRASDQSLRSASATQEDSLTAESLAVDTLTAVVDDYFITPRVLAVQGLLAAAGGLPCYAAAETPVLSPNDYGDVVEYRRGDSLLLKHYLEKPTRVGPTRWKLSCVSGIGLLLNSYHWGGIYTGQPLRELVADIIGGIIPYTLDQELGEMLMYGWLPKDTRRNNLRMALFASGGVVGKDANGDLTILPSTQPEPYPISPSRIYMGGSVAGVTPASAVAVTEHSYIALDADETVTLYEGEASGAEITTPMGLQVTGVLVEFNDPMHDLQAANTEILESGANYAVIGGSASCTLTGQKYNHTQRVITRTVPGAVKPNVVSSSQCGLVNALNSESVAARLTAYYAATRDVEIDLVVEGQKPGDAVTFTDPFGDDVTGYIRSLDLTMSGILKGTGRVADGYIPTASGNFFSHYLLLTEDTDFVVPPEANGLIRVALSSGGQGGENGAPGQPGEPGKNSDGKGGEGGEPGSPGAGGRLLVQTLSVTAGQHFAVHIGSGGAPGENGTGGQLGEDTTFGSLTTASAKSSDVGYVNILTGEIYASAGPVGIKGGKGNGDNDETDPVTGPDGTVYYPGENGTGYYVASRPNSKGYGGRGGGAAVGSNGGPGGEADIFLSSGDLSATITGGDGGKGANAAAQPDATIPGAGGPGGHGGGGGGGGGGATAESGDEAWTSQGGSPGQGGLAGAGASGFALVIY